MKRNFITLMMALVAVMTTTAATFSGRVVDETGMPASFANVVLLNASDSAFVTGTITDADGLFSLAGNSAQPVIKISYLGYKTLMIDTPTGDLGVISLEPESTTLGEVVIKGERPTFKSLPRVSRPTWRTHC